MNGTDPDDRDIPSAADAPMADGFVAIVKDDGSVVIYDESASTAWIKSDATVSLDAMA